MDVGFFIKWYCVVEILSGGMKRKFLVVMVFVVGLRIVILDEFIVGVDFYVWRVIWDLLIKYKKGDYRCRLICFLICYLFIMLKVIVILLL